MGKPLTLVNSATGKRYAQAPLHGSEPEAVQEVLDEEVTARLRSERGTGLIELLIALTEQIAIFAVLR